MSPGLLMTCATCKLLLLAGDTHHTRHACARSDSHGDGKPREEGQGGEEKGRGWREKRRRGGGRGRGTKNGEVGEEMRRGSRARYGDGEGVMG